MAVLQVIILSFLWLKEIKDILKPFNIYYGITERMD